MPGRLFIVFTLALVTAPVSAAEPTPAQIEFFERKIRPVLVEHCVSCHGEKKQMAGLRLDTAEGLRKGTDEGPIVVPGNAAKSKLLQSVRREGDYPMPPKQALPGEAVAALTEWVAAGAPFPSSGGATQVNPTAARTHWAFLPVQDPAVPAVKTPAPNPLDRFLLAKLEARKLTFAPPADRRTLIRRAYFDLIGLPPTAEEVEAFAQDTAPDAYERLIDKLLASPHYGERWGRHWLDLARYGDTKGYVFQEDRNYPYAYTYRDYVIRSFNEDKPYNQFILEQLAADRLPNGSDNRSLAALGFLTVGRRFINNIHDIIDDRIDVVTRGLMGLTVTCARCHDHKYDPVPIADYYSLYGVFASSTEPKDLPLIGEVARSKEYEAFEAELKKREQALAEWRTKRHGEIVAELRTKESIAKYLLAVARTPTRNGEAVQGIIRQLGLRPAAFLRWQQFLAAEEKKPSAVFDPWFALAKLPEKDFPTAAAAVVARLGSDPKRPVHPGVLKALRAAKLQSLTDVANVYGAVLAAAWPAPAGTIPAEQQPLLAVVGKGGPVDVPVAETDRLFDRADRNKQTELQRKIDQFKATSPVAPPRAMVLTDAPTPVQPVVFLRGNPQNRGPAIPRQFLEVLSGSNRKPFTDGSGRLELARAIASPENPLTARVFVNRVWMYHFGQPLVRTPSDFGTRSEPPTHPELLDWLAKRFIEDGWSIKKLHKRLMLSAAYQQSSVARPESLRADPENRLVGRMNRKRADFEALRDGFLAVSGKLDRKLYGRSVDLFAKPYPVRRSVYGFVDRQNLPGTLRSFDFPSPDLHNPQRPVTTVPQQALFLMNSPFIAEQAVAVVARPEVASAKAPAERVRRIYRVVLARNPSPDEVKLGQEFVAACGAEKPAAGQLGPWELFTQTLLLSNEFAFVD